MSRMHFRRPATGTILGALALGVASVAAFAALHDSSSAAVPAPAEGQPAFKRNIRYVERDFELEAGDGDVFVTRCPEGFRVIPGGHFISKPFVTVPHSYPTGLHDGWVVAALNSTGLPQVDSKVSVFAICAKHGAPVVP